MKVVCIPTHNKSLRFKHQIFLYVMLTMISRKILKAPNKICKGYANPQSDSLTEPHEFPLMPIDKFTYASSMYIDIHFKVGLRKFVRVCITSNAFKSWLLRT